MLWPGELRGVCGSGVRLGTRWVGAHSLLQGTEHPGWMLRVHETLLLWILSSLELSWSHPTLDP